MPEPAPDLAALRENVTKFGRKLELDSIPAYVKLILGKEIPPGELTQDQATKVVNAMKAKATRLGIALEGAPKTAGGATEKQLQFIEALVGRGRITPAQIQGYIQDVNPHASIPEHLNKREASKLIDRLTGLSGGANRKKDEDF
jgi:hypothetical protein